MRGLLKESPFLLKKCEFFTVFSQQKHRDIHSLELYFKPENSIIFLTVHILTVPTITTANLFFS